MTTHPDLQELNEDPDFEAVILDDDEQISPAPAWLISLAVHALILLIMSLIVFGSLVEEEPPIKAAILERPQDIEEEKEKPREFEEVTQDIPDDTIVEDPVITELEVEVEELSTEEPVEEEVAEAKGDPEMAATSEMASAMTFAAIGTGSTAPGLKGRTKAGKKRALGPNGGTPASEAAVNAALLWFKRHQSPNGQWDVDGYMDNCQDDLKCEPGTAYTAAGADGDTACTAYATLCFLGSGHDHRTPGRFQKTVQKALEWLKQAQNADGSFGAKKRNYENGVCAMALCEAYAMTMDPSLKEPAQRAVNLLLERQAKSDKFEYGCGWYYAAPNPAQNDGSVSGWCIMALKAAKSADLDVGDGWTGAADYVDAAWKAANPNHADMDSYAQSVFPYRFNQEAGTADKPRLAAVGALCSVFLGKQRGDVMLDTLMNTIMAKQLPKAYPCNTYYMYYNTLAAFQYNGEEWKKWNAQVRDMLVDAQHGAGSGCFDGSWDYEGTVFHGHETGRLLSTAYCCLSLEVYYRYERIKGRANKH